VYDCSVSVCNGNINHAIVNMFTVGYMFIIMFRSCNTHTSKQKISVGPHAVH